MHVRNRAKSSPQASMSNLFERRHKYTCDLYQFHRNTTFRSTVDVIPIRFHLFKGYANYNPETHEYENQYPATLSLKKTLKLRFSREKASCDATRMARFTRFNRVIAKSPREANKLRNKLAKYLCTTMRLRLPQDKHSLIIDEIMDMLPDADPDKIIEVVIMDVIFRDTEESLRLDVDELYRAKLIPAAESFIQSLEEAASPPDEELECAICMEMFATEKDSSITQLPCSHYYHLDCIVPWLHINHLCPTCRRSNAPSREGS